MFSIGVVNRSSTSSRVRTLPCPFPSCFKPTSLCNLSSLSNAVVITVNANQALNRMRIRIDTCADDGMPAGRTGHGWNARVWISRLSGAHYGQETAASPEICRLLLAKPKLRSDYPGQITISWLLCPYCHGGARSTICLYSVLNVLGVLGLVRQS